MKMDKYAISEVSYKNGFNSGVKEFAEKLKEMLGVKNFGLVDNLAKELTESK
jgi:hypothetical protein